MRLTLCHDPSIPILNNKHFKCHRLCIYEYLFDRARLGLFVECKNVGENIFLVPVADLRRFMVCGLGLSPASLGCAKSEGAGIALVYPNIFLPRAKAAVFVCSSSKPFFFLPPPTRRLPQSIHPQTIPRLSSWYCLRLIRHVSRPLDASRLDICKSPY